MFSHVWLFATPWTVGGQASLFFTISWILLKFVSIELMMPSSHLTLCHPFLLMPSIFPSVSLFLSQLFASDGQSTRVWTSASVLPVNIQDWFSLGLTGLISLLSKGLSRVFSSTTVWKYQFFGIQPSLWSLSHICTWQLRKTLTRWTFLAKWCLSFLLYRLGLS